ncbi:hypothetical protein AB0D32_30810 [Micromonospora sp. NPDC048170]
MSANREHSIHLLHDTDVCAPRPPVHVPGLPGDPEQTPLLEVTAAG